MMIDRSDGIQSETSRMPFKLALYWTIGGWFIFVCGFLLVCLVHYNSEMLQNSDQLWFTTHILLGLVVAPILWRGTGCFRHSGSRFGAFTLQCLAGFFVYLVLCFLYLYEWAGFSM